MGWASLMLNPEFPSDIMKMDQSKFNSLYLTILHMMHGRHFFGPDQNANARNSQLGLKSVNLGLDFGLLGLDAGQGLLALSLESNFEAVKRFQQLVHIGH